MSIMDMAKGDGGEGAEKKTPGAGDEGTKDTSKGDEGTKTGDEGEGASGGEGEGEKRDFKTARPDNVPEKFWDADKGVAKTDEILKSYGELEKALTKAKEKPKAPEKYELKISEEITKDFGMDKIPDDDPYLTGFRSYAKEQGLSQEQHDAFVNWYLKMDLTHGRQTMISEFAKLGDEKQATQRIKTLHNWGANKLTPEERQVMSAMINTKAGVELFEKIVKMTTGQRQLAEENPDKIEKTLTQDDLDDMMADERYTNKRHPEYHSYHAKVAKAFQSLYPDK